jgi:prevent-host-death family protein
MKQYNIAEAKSHFSLLVKKALMGEEIVIARDNKPLIKLVPLSEVKQRRQPGSGKGQVAYIAPDFCELPGDFKDYV